MKRSELKLLVDECYRQLGPEETANLVDGIKDVGFQFATRGGMTIGLWDIVTPDRQGQRASRRPTTAVTRHRQASSSAASSPRTSATSRSSSSGSGRRRTSRTR